MPHYELKQPYSQIYVLPLGCCKREVSQFLLFLSLKKTKPQLGERQEKKKFTEGTIFLLLCVIALLTFCSII